MKLTWNQEAGVLHIDADVADSSDMLFMEHVRMQHAPEAAGVAAFARAAVNHRYTPCEEPPRGPVDKPGAFVAPHSGAGGVDVDGWRVFTGFDVPLARLEFSRDRSPAERSRANAASCLGHSLLDALELAIARPH